MKLQENTYKELVAEGEQQLDAVHLLIRFQRQLQLEHQEVQLPVLVLVLFSHLCSPHSKKCYHQRIFKNLIHIKVVKFLEKNGDIPKE